MYCDFVQLICFFVIATNCQEVLYGSQSYVRTSRQTNDSCQLPHYPEFGYWEIYKQDHQSPGKSVSSGTVLQIRCKDKYKLDGEKTVVCINGHWSRSVGQCLRTCRSLYSTPAIRVTCTYNDRKLDDCNEALTGTKAHFQCGDFYEDLKLERNPTSVCYNGRWSDGVPQCAPVCGRKSPKDPTLIVGGKNVTKGEFPWQAALYNATDKDLLCGGSLLNQRVILTAAHCVTGVNGEVLSRESYIVAVGKYYRRYDHPQDFNDAQFSEVDQIFVPKNFKADIQNYFGDIAIIVTKRTFELSLRVQPVCVDWSLKHFPNLLDPSIIQHGYVSGWGLTVEYKSPSSVLKELKVPIVYDHESCVSKLPQDYDKYFTDDKLCAGFLDRGTSVCRGDSGGGLVSKFGNRFYVVAVVSISPQAYTQEGGCDSNQVALYTKVSYYINNFIQEKEVQFRPYPPEEVPCEEDPNCRISPVRTNFSSPEYDGLVGGASGGGTSGAGEAPSLSNSASGDGGSSPLVHTSHFDNSPSLSEDEEPPKYTKPSDDDNDSEDPPPRRRQPSTSGESGLKTAKREEPPPDDDELPPPRRKPSAVSTVSGDDGLPSPRRSQTPDDDVMQPPRRSQIPDDDLPPPPQKPSAVSRVSADDKLPPYNHLPPPPQNPSAMSRVSANDKLPPYNHLPPPPQNPSAMSRVSAYDKLPPPNHLPPPPQNPSAMSRVSANDKLPPPNHLPPPPRNPPSAGTIPYNDLPPPGRSQIPDDDVIPPPRRKPIPGGTTSGDSPPHRTQASTSGESPSKSTNSESDGGFAPRNSATRRATRRRIG